MTDKDPHVIGARIARRRHQLGWSQVELAQRIGVSPSSVANWERGFSYPKKKIGRVEQVLGISLDADTGPPATPSPLEKALGSAEAAEDVRRRIRAQKGRDADWYISAVEDLFRQPPSAGESEPPARGSGRDRREG